MSRSTSCKQPDSLYFWLGADAAKYDRQWVYSKALHGPFEFGDPVNSIRFNSNTRRWESEYIDTRTIRDFPRTA